MTTDFDEGVRYLRQKQAEVNGRLRDLEIGAIRVIETVLIIAGGGDGGTGTGPTPCPGGPVTFSGKITACTSTGVTGNLSVTGANTGTVYFNSAVSGTGTFSFTTTIYSADAVTNGLICVFTPTDSSLATTTVFKTVACGTGSSAFGFICANAAGYSCGICPLPISNSLTMADPVYGNFSTPHGISWDSGTVRTANYVGDGPIFAFATSIDLEYAFGSGFITVSYWHSGGNICYSTTGGAAKSTLTFAASVSCPPGFSASAVVPATGTQSTSSKLIWGTANLPLTLTIS